MPSWNKIVKSFGVSSRAFLKSSTAWSVWPFLYVSSAFFLSTEAVSASTLSFVRYSAMAGSVSQMFQKIYSANE
ncbi:MAG: hypothetical protein ACD_47C00109G0001 [uncultured bacterium]|nr:MAG: hypothetical protein ACD_47C00109G0001 [uncultured bacterium]